MLSLLRKLAKPLLEARRLLLWPTAPPCNYTDQPRKSPAEIRRDLLAWKRKFGTITFDYFRYGADIQGHRIENYLPRSLFKTYRDTSNATLVHNDDFNYECLLGDKLLFGQFAAARGHPTPELYAVLDPDRFEVSSTRAVHAPHEFTRVFAGRTGILKPATGCKGANIFRVEVTPEAVRLGDELLSADKLFERLRTRYIFQELIEQHADLARLNPSSVNTLRLITAWHGDEVLPITAMLRIGLAGSPTDNWSQGGVAVGVDLERGCLQGGGVYPQGRPIEKTHPDSGIVYDGYSLPHFAQAVDAARAFHRDLYGLHSIGWDLAFTESGPTIIEGNSRWGPLHMVLDPAFVGRYLAALGSTPPTPHRHTVNALVGRD